MKLRLSKYFALFGLLGVVLTLINCASIVNGSSQNIAISSEPEGATILKNGFEIGKTPASVTFSRKDGGSVIKIQKDGYKTSNIILNDRISAAPVFLGNIVLGGLLFSPLFIAIDFISGAAWELDPAAINVQLEKVTSKPSE